MKLEKLANFQSELTFLVKWSPVLKDLHWLPIEQIIEYKVLLPTY